MTGGGVRLLIATVVGVSLSGCGGRSALPLNQAQQVPTAPPVLVPAPAAANYVLNPLDVIRVDVFGEPELSFATLPINTDGVVVMPMIGAVKADGLTAEQLAAAMALRLNRYLRAPKVAVNVIEFNSQKITVSGEVNRPGQYVAPGRISLAQAVAVGGGLNGNARSDEVIVLRDQAGVRYAARFDLHAIQDGQAVDPPLLPGDTVLVGGSSGRGLGRQLLTVLPIAAGLFVALLPRL